MSDGEKKRKPNPGAFKPGQSGNPLGRTPGQRGIYARLVERFGEDIEGLIDIEIRLAKGESVPGYEDVKARDRLFALQDAADRVAGKALTQISGSVDIGVSEDQQALLDAIKLSPEERRKRLAEIGDEPPG